MNWTEWFSDIPSLALMYSINAVVAIALFVLGKWVAKRIIQLVGNLLKLQDVDATVVGFVSNILYVALLAIIIIASLSQLGVPTASFIAIVGAAGLAIGLALQGSLSNFAAGVLLVTFQPCRVGDYIEAAGESGTVKVITIFSTTLITPDQRTITIPNSNVFGGPIVNYSTSTSRRLDLTIGISYSADIAAVKVLLENLVRSDKRVLRELPMQIGVLELAESSVKLAVRPWVSNENYWPLRFDLLESIKSTLDEAGVEIPYPQLGVHWHQNELQPAQ